MAYRRARISAIPQMSGLCLIVGLLLIAATASAAPPGAPGPVPPSQVVPDRYIVVLHDTVPSAAAVAVDLERRLGIAVSHVYEHALRGFAANVPPGRLLALQRDPRVAYVEPDQTVYAFAQVVPTGIRRIFADKNDNLSINQKDDYRVDVDVAVIDTGIADHPDLNIVGRVNCSGGSPMKQSCSDGGTDGNGHGTHVAGTIAALDNDFGVVGVAPGARLWSVKVLADNGNGYMSWIIAGVDWVTKESGTIAVANMSLGCECSSSALDKAISASVVKGVVYVVAAGNSAKDASTFSPANHPDVITVSALADFDGKPGRLGDPTCRADEDDTLANFSNFGPLVELAAPGVCILSTWLNGGYHTISGTSMAAPHVAGAAALLVTQNNKPTNRDGALAVLATLQQNGNLNWVDERDLYEEPLLDVGNDNVFKPHVTATSTTASEPSDPGDGGTAATLMGVYRIDWSGTKHLDVTVNIRKDSNDPNGLTTDDAAVSGAGVTFDLTHQQTARTWKFAGNTDSNGNFRGRLLNAPSGDYTALVTSVTASNLTWEPMLDIENPDTYKKR